MGERVKVLSGRRVLEMRRCGHYRFMRGVVTTRYQV